jgi:hypothetical protein
MNHDIEQQNGPLSLNENANREPKEIQKNIVSEIEQDTALAQKTQLVNDAINEIGFTSYQLKLFFLNGFGYAVDSLLILLNALTQPQVALQYHPVVSKAQTIAMGVGLLLGALFWGLGADVSFILYRNRRCESVFEQF